MSRLCHANATSHPWDKLSWHLQCCFSKHATPQRNTELPVLFEFLRCQASRMPAAMSGLLTKRKRECWHLIDKGPPPSTMKALEEGRLTFGTSKQWRILRPNSTLVLPPLPFCNSTLVLQPLLPEQTFWNTTLVLQSCQFSVAIQRVCLSAKEGLSLSQGGGWFSNFRGFSWL